MSAPTDPVVAFRAACSAVVDAEIEYEDAMEELHAMQITVARKENALHRALAERNAAASAFHAAGAK